jgi:hypothetical protein
MRYNYEGGWGTKEEVGEEWIKKHTQTNYPIIYVEPTWEEKMEKNKNKLISDINELFELIDNSFNMNDNLINVIVANEYVYKDYKQTLFGEKLKDFLKFLVKEDGIYWGTNKCDKFINKLFANLSIDNPMLFDKSKWVSAATCNGSWNISKLYTLLKDKKFTRQSIINMNKSAKNKLKTELKTELLSYLFKICQDEEKKNIINSIQIPDDKYEDLDLDLKNPIKENPFQPFLSPDINNTYYTDSKFTGGGGNTKITRTSKKEILGKERCIYKKSGDRKEYVKHKGDLITVSEYKKIMIAKNKK